jgi:hypothetical protein
LLSISNIASFFDKYSLIHVSIGASLGNSSIPSCLSSINQSSSSEHIIHSDTSPLILVFEIINSGASLAQTVATGTFIQAFTFGAPQTIVKVFQQTSTVVQFNFSEFGCFSQVFTFQINTFFKCSHS